jgi:tRNA modification GTPase
LAQAETEAMAAIPAGLPCLPVINKSDLPCRLEIGKLENAAGSKPVLVSAIHRQGLEELERAIFEAVSAGKIEASDDQITRERHLRCVQEALESMLRAEKALEAREPLECVAIETRGALNALRELIGEVYTDDLLDVIFSEFCIGK